MDQAENLWSKTQKERYSIQRMGDNKEVKLVQCVPLGPFASLCNEKILLQKNNPPKYCLIPNNDDMPKAIKEEKPPEDQEAFFTVKQVYE